MSLPILPTEIVLQILQKAELTPVQLWPLSQSTPKHACVLTEAASDNSLWRAWSPQTACDNANAVPLRHAFRERLACKSPAAKAALADFHRFGQARPLTQHALESVIDFVDDFDVMLAASHVTGTYYAMVGQPLASERTLALVAFAQQGGQHLCNASLALRDDPLVVQAAVNSWGPSLCYASRRLRDDPKTVTTAYLHDASAYAYAGEALRNDKDFVHSLFARKPSAYLMHAMPSVLRQEPPILDLFRRYFKYILMEDGILSPTQNQLAAIYDLAPSALDGLLEGANLQLIRT